MIPRVETDISGSAAHCQAILSDFSDEQIVKTLKLNLENGHADCQNNEQMFLNMPLQMISHQNRQQNTTSREQSSLQSLSNHQNYEREIAKDNKFTKSGMFVNKNRPEIYEMPSFNQSPSMDVKLTPSNQAHDAKTCTFMKSSQRESRKSSVMVDSENEEQIIHLNSIKMCKQQMPKRVFEEFTQPQPAVLADLQPAQQPVQPIRLDNYES